MRLNVVITCLALCVLEGAIARRRHLLTSFGIPHVHPSSTDVYKTGSLPALFWDGIDPSAAETSDIPSDAADRYPVVLQPDVGQHSWVPPDLATLETLLSGRLRPSPSKRSPLVTELGHYELLRLYWSLSSRSALDSTQEPPADSMETFRKRDRYNCDFSRVSIQMIIEYLRSRRICGYRVNQMRFALGGK